MTTEPTTDPLTPESVERWREQVDNRTVDPNLPWKDSEVIELVARFLDTIAIEREARAALLDELEAAVAERIDIVGIERGRAHAEQLHDYEGGVEFSHNLFVGLLALIQQHREEGT